MNKIAPAKLIALLKSLPSPLHVASGVVDQKNSIGFVDTDSGVLIVDPTESTCGRFNGMRAGNPTLTAPCGHGWCSDVGGLPAVRQELVNATGHVRG
jgi:hypothetical protein